jgi:hypothetical protein
MAGDGGCGRYHHAPGGHDRDCGYAAELGPGPFFPDRSFRDLVPGEFVLGRDLRLVGYPNDGRYCGAIGLGGHWLIVLGFFWRQAPRSLGNRRCCATGGTATQVYRHPGPEFVAAEVGAWYQFGRY